MPEYIMSFDLDETGKLINAKCEQELVRCGECLKHNISTNYRDSRCPLVDFRGAAQGHEFDYQFCCYGKRKEDA